MLGLMALFHVMVVWWLAWNGLECREIQESALARTSHLYKVTLRPHHRPDFSSPNTEMATITSNTKLMRSPSAGMQGEIARKYSLHLLGARSDY